MTQIESIHLASRAEPKIQALHSALSQLNILVKSIIYLDSSSNVNDQPIGWGEITLGARNRVSNLLRQGSKGIIIAIENGIVLDPDSSWRDYGLVLGNHNSNEFISKSDGVTFPVEAYNLLMSQGGPNQLTIGKILAQLNPSLNHRDWHAYFDPLKRSRVQLLTPAIIEVLTQIINSPPDGDR